MSLINERQIGLKTGGNYTLLKDYLDRIKAVRAPFNETQEIAGLVASNGVVIPASLIPANVAIADNLKVSDGAYTTVAKIGGIITAEGTAVTGFSTPGTFVWENKVVSDDYGNILNAVQIRAEGTEDPITDTDGHEVFGLLVRANGVADGATVAANPNENLEICFVVNQDGNLVVPVGGVSGIIDFNLTRAFAERNQAKIALDGGNQTDMDVIADTSAIKFSDYTVTTAFGAGETLNLTTGVGSGTGVATVGGDINPIQLNASAPDFNADNTCICTNNGVKGTKGTSLDFTWASANMITILAPLDVTDIVGIERRY